MSVGTQQLPPYRRGTRSHTATIGLAARGLLVALLLATVATAPLPHEDGTEAFERNIYPFPVLDAEGKAYEHPLLGGFNLPRPQLVDIDGDADLDLFVQEFSGELMLFEQIGTPAAPRYVWRTDRFQDLDIGEWYLFSDVDRDGDPDLLAETRFSLIRYWRNDSNDGAPEMALVTERLLDIDGEPMFSDRQNIPKLVDLDCDGRLELMVGRVEGTISRYEVDRVDDGAPVFRHLGDRFQNIEIIGQVLNLPGLRRPQQQQQQQFSGPRGGLGVPPIRSPAGPLGAPPMRSPAGPSWHGANTMAFEDIDGDGDLDLFWGDFFEPGLLFIENKGSCRSPSMRTEPLSFPLNHALKTSGYNAPAFGDIDADGDPDLLVGVLGGAFNPSSTSVDNLLYLKNTGKHRFSLETRRFLTQIDVGSDSFPAFADIDADGDLDLFLSNKIEPGDTKAGRIFLFENIGTATAPRLQLRGPMESFTSAYHYAPAFGDLDADGDLDILMGTWDDDLQLIRNDGTPTDPRWSVADPAVVTLTRGRNATPTLADIDADGDLDLFVGESSGQINFYRNEGSPQQPHFELVADKYLDIDVGRRSTPTFTDLDADGDLDLIIGSEAEGVTLYRNNGTPENPAFERDEGFSLPVHPFVTPVFADLNGNGVSDFFAGSIGGGLVHFARRDN